MIPRDIAALLHQLELVTRKHISGPLLGDYRRALKGGGFEFHQLREYIQGDDIRFIDWKASARSQKMLVREYLEDRNRTVYIVVDISGSTNYGTGSVTKRDLMKELAAVLAFVALHEKDSVGLILYTDEVEKVIAPRQSRNHVVSMLTTLYSYEPKSRKTNLAAPLDYLVRMKGQRAVVFFLSDFAAMLDRWRLTVAARHHELVALRCLDEREWVFPPIGTLVIEDSETGMTCEVEGGIADSLVSWNRHQKDLLRSARIDCLDLIAGKPYAGELVRFLKQRIA